MLGCIAKGNRLAVLVGFDPPVLLFVLLYAGALYLSLIHGTIILDGITRNITRSLDEGRTWRNVRVNGLVYDLVLYCIIGINVLLRYPFLGIYLSLLQRHRASSQPRSIPSHPASYKNEQITGYRYNYITYIYIKQKQKTRAAIETPGYDQTSIDGPDFSPSTNMCLSPPCSWEPPYASASVAHDEQRFPDAPSATWCPIPQHSWSTRLCQVAVWAELGHRREQSATPPHRPHRLHPVEIESEPGVS